MNADTTVHLAHVQDLFYKFEVLLYLFDKKIKFQQERMSQESESLCPMIIFLKSI